MSLKNIGHSAVGFAFVAVVTNFLRRWVIDQDHDGLIEPDLKPGPWYGYYMGDFMTAHNTLTVTSAIVQLGDSFVWATNTPEWDQEWFEKRGYEFPAKWITFDQLRQVRTEPAEFGE